MSADVWFYRLDAASLEQGAPPLIEKCLERSWRVLVRGDESARLAALDAALWTFRPDAFIPHGLEGRDDPARNPVWLTTSPTGNPNRAQALVLLGAAWEEQRASFARVLVVFEGTDEAAVQRARGRWRTVKAAGETAHFWSLDAQGRWEKQG